jgi:putative oxidoreductase
MTMYYVVHAVRLVLGSAFLVFGLDYFLKFLPMPTPELTPAAPHFMSALAPSGYLSAVKVLEITGGLLLLSGLLVPLGLVFLTPVIVNIALYDIFLMGQPGLGLVLLPLAVFLIWAYRAYFAAVFTTRAQPSTACCGVRRTATTVGAV